MDNEKVFRAREEGKEKRRRSTHTEEGGSKVKQAHTHNHTQTHVSFFVFMPAQILCLDGILFISTSSLCKTTFTSSSRPIYLFLYRGAPFSELLLVLNTHVVNKICPFLLPTII